jgi:hypothetical protein
MGRFFYVLQGSSGKKCGDVRFVPTVDIRDDVNEKERPPCGGLSKAVHVRYAALDF